nr:immunoglobulin heavy chain junction region [Mus musculus]MBK4198326.1 immunoglobulin heavy chain junction region [Mus musculus]MBK4198327.1 immunoglobulin heavy chain junction region [Mus musculus]MBK4198328.1 immunoglobulin heavy chain junction region [Mus musculus]MBK4198330.1 immunoglobulin heavy chain junction region [Mus musculus]
CARRGPSWNSYYFDYW